MSWIHTLATHAATRWVAGGLLAAGGWALYQTATAQTTPPASPDDADPAPVEQRTSPAVEAVPAPSTENGIASTLPTEAPSPDPAGIEALVTDRVRAERNHLWRVAAWGSANMIGGLALRLASDPTDTRAFGFQSATWGAVNVSIAVAGLLNSRDRPTTWRSAVDAERRYHDILLANLGLNIGYASVGTAMVVASAYDVDRAAEWRGHGSALILQGAGLFVLDAIAWLGSRRRIVDFLSMPGDLSARPLPVGGALTWRF